MKLILIENLNLNFYIATRELNKPHSIKGENTYSIALALRPKSNGRFRAGCLIFQQLLR